MAGVIGRCGWSRRLELAVAWLESSARAGVSRLADEFDVEDELGLGGDGAGLPLGAVGELVGDEEAALAADAHACEAGVPAGDDLVPAVGEGEGFCAG